MQIFNLFVTLWLGHYYTCNFLFKWFSSCAILCLWSGITCHQNHGSMKKNKCGEALHFILVSLVLFYFLNNLTYNFYNFLIFFSGIHHPYNFLLQWFFINQIVCLLLLKNLMFWKCLQFIKVLLNNLEYNLYTFLLSSQVIITRIVFFYNDSQSAQWYVCGLE